MGAASVTEMEVLHALINPFHRSLPRNAAKTAEYYERAKYAFFYLRDPSYLDRLPSDPPMVRETYTNEWVEDEAEREAHDQALRNWREQKIPDSNRPFHFYLSELGQNPAGMGPGESAMHRCIRCTGCLSCRSRLPAMATPSAAEPPAVTCSSSTCEASYPAPT